MSRQLRKGWEIVVLVFRIPASWIKDAEEPAGVGLDLVSSLPLPNPPEHLLEQLATILPQGPGIVRAFMECRPIWIDRPPWRLIGPSYIRAFFRRPSWLNWREGLTPISGKKWVKTNVFLAFAVEFVYASAVENSKVC